MINERLFGSPISGQVRKKLEDRQRVAGELAFGESIEAVYPDKDGKNQADLSSRTPFVRMWTSVKLIDPGKVSERLEKLDNIDDLTNPTAIKFRKDVYQKKLDEQQKTFPEAKITKIDGDYYIVDSSERPEVDYERKIYIVGDYNYGANYSSAEQTEDNVFFPQELKNNQLLKPITGITGVSSQTRGLKNPTKTTTVSFVVHNFEDFDNIYNRYFLKPGAKIFVDFGWSSVKNLYNPNDLINSTNILEYLYGDSKNVVPGYEDEDGNIVEERNEIDGQVTLNQGDLEVIQGTVIDYSAKILKNGSVECEVTLISQNAALLNFNIDEPTKIHVEDVLRRSTLLLGVQATLNDEVLQGKVVDFVLNPNYYGTGPGALTYFDGTDTYTIKESFEDLTPDFLDILQTPNAESSEDDIKNYINRLTTLAIGQLGGHDFTPKSNSIRTGIFVDSITADDIYVCWGFIEDIIINQNFGFGKNGDDINNDDNLQVRMDSSTQFTTWNQLFVDRQQVLSKVNEGAPVFLFPEWWGDADPGDDTSFGDGSYNYFNNKYPRAHYNNDELHDTTDILKNRIPIREVFVNVETVVSAFKENDNLTKVINQILSKINKESYGIFDWTMSTLPGVNSQITIVDNNHIDTNQRILESGISETSQNGEDSESDAFKNLFTFNIMSPNSIIKDYNLEFKLPIDKIGNMYAIEAMSHENLMYPITQELNEISELANLDTNNLSIISEPDTGGFRGSQINSKYNKKASNFDEFEGAKNLIDSNIYKTSAIRNQNDIITSGGEERNPEGGIPIGNVINFKDANNSDKDQKKEKQINLIERNINYLITGGNIVVTSFSEYFNIKEMQSIVLNQNSTPPLLPYSLSLTTYGIGFVHPGDTFRVDYLPKRHFKTTYLQTMMVAHDVNSDGWYTTLETQYRPAEASGKTDSMTKDIDREKVFLSPKTLNNLNLTAPFYNVTDGKQMELSSLMNYMTNLKIKDINKTYIDMVISFMYFNDSKKDLIINVGGKYTNQYAVSAGLYKGKGEYNERYINIEGYLEEWSENTLDVEQGKYKEQIEKLQLGESGIQGVIPPLITMKHEETYFLVIQKNKYFVADSDDLIDLFDLYTKNTTPGTPVVGFQPSGFSDDVQNVMDDYAGTF